MNDLVKNFSFQGVSGAFSEMAGKEVYQSAISIPCKTFEEMFEAVRNDKADRAIVPIENSRAGRVADTQRLIPNSKLKIVGEFFLEIKHCLMAPKNSSIDSIQRVYSHEQAIAQCRENLIKLNKEMVIVADTAGAAKLIAKLNDNKEAAIASKLASQIYDLDIIDPNIQDSSYNVTRFLIMSKKMEDFQVDLPDLITTLVFKVRSMPAALYKSLGGFASNGVNLTKLESYIHPQGFNVAQFYIDFEGHPEAKHVKMALEEMSFFCEEINILGVYKSSDFRKK